MASILQKLKKNSKLEGVDILSESKFYDNTNKQSLQCPTEIPMLNVALSGDVDGGMSPGILMIAGDSKHFKTGFMLECAKGFMNKHNEDAVILFYDSEKGAPIDYFKSRGIPMDQVLHSPIRHIEELKFDLVRQLEFIEKEDKANKTKTPVMIMIDSIGMLPSKKELMNALNENEAADMTRARELNSFFRIITPMLAFGDIPCVLINHAYDAMDGSHKKTISGGKKVYLAADDVWIIGRQQDGSGSDINGFFFVVNIDKSREVKEKSKIFIYCSMEEGINKWSGLLEEAKELGYVQMGAWCKYMDFETGEMSGNVRRATILQDDEWFKRLLQDEDFRAHLAEKYTLA